MGTKAIPIYIPAKRPRIGTIGKNHIQSSSNLSGTALFVVCSESDTFLKNYSMKDFIALHENPQRTWQERLSVIRACKNPFRGSEMISWRL